MLEVGILVVPPAPIKAVLLVNLMPQVVDDHGTIDKLVIFCDAPVVVIMASLSLTRLLKAPVPPMELNLTPPSVSESRTLNPVTLLPVVVIFAVLLMLTVPAPYEIFTPDTPQSELPVGP